MVCSTHLKSLRMVNMTILMNLQPPVTRYKKNTAKRVFSTVISKYQYMNTPAKAKMIGFINIFKFSTNMCTDWFSKNAN